MNDTPTPARASTPAGASRSTEADKAELAASDPAGRYPNTVPLANRALDERDAALAEVRNLSHDLDKTLRRARKAEGRARRAEAKLAEILGPRERHPRHTVAVEERLLDLALEVIHHLRDRGCATPDELLDLAIVVANAGRPAAAWEAAQALAAKVTT